MYADLILQSSICPARLKLYKSVHMILRDDENGHANEDVLLLAAN